MHGLHYCCLLLGISEPELGCALEVEAEGAQPLLEQQQQQQQQQQQLGFEVGSFRGRWQQLLECHSGGDVHLSWCNE
jgi:hypothetical protein